MAICSSRALSATRPLSSACWNRPRRDSEPVTRISPRRSGLPGVPTSSRAFSSKLFGDSDQTVFRGGYSIAYTREGFNAYTSMFGSNDGPTITLNVSPANAGYLPYREACSSADGPTFLRSLLRLTQPLPAACHRSRQRQRLRSGPEARLHPVLLVRPPARTQQEHGGRGSLCRHARHSAVAAVQLQRE